MTDTPKKYRYKDTFTIKESGDVVIMTRQDGCVFSVTPSSFQQGLEPVPVEQAAQGWRPIAEGHRDLMKDQDFLVLVKSDFIGSESVTCQACYMGDELCIYSEQHFGHFPLRASRIVTHWMPLAALQKPPAREGGGA